MNSTLRPLNRQTAEISQSYPERVVQFGGGNFLRGFVEWIIEALNQQAGFASSVVIVKPTPGGSYETLATQEGLFHLQLHEVRDGTLVTERSLITCVSRAINPYEDYAAYLALARQPDIRFIISNTTEVGLAFAAEDQLSDAPSSSFPAKATAFLYERFRQFGGQADKGCILLPCELVEGNGDLLKQLILQYADLWNLEPEFAQWIETSNQFCNTLVDRIVTGYPKGDSEAILEDIGFDDHLLLEAERYHSWVIEAPQSLKDELPVHKTDLNVRIVDDVEPYRKEKVRILNGAHTAMMPLGYLLGLETVQQAIEHPQLGLFIRELVYSEIIPSFEKSDEHLEQFARDVLNRFRSPFIHHLLISIAFKSISKFKIRLVPTIISYESRYHKLPRHVVLAFAGLICFYKGEWNGSVIPLNDDAAVISWFADQWQAGIGIRTLVENVLANENFWEEDLRQIDGLVDLITEYLTKIDDDGIEAVLQHFEG